ncbi:MAG: hypothetical protein HOP15_04215 [Planctomycetes bacterium]|nr:hypothetical protein [Planctomycetota bacterium]
MAKKKQAHKDEESAPRSKRRGIDQRIADLEAKIAAIKEREAKKQAKADPALRHASAALRSIDKALAASKDTVTRQALGEARVTLSACLTLNRAGSAGRRSEARRSSAALDNLPEVLLNYVRSNPGQRGEQIAAALATDTTAMRPVMKRLIEAGQVRTAGQRRGMTYSPA